MPVLTNSIGGYNMLAIQGKPYTRQEEIEHLTRLGLDGDFYRRLGKHSKPFPLVSIVDVGSHTLGRVAYNAYIALKDGDPVPVVLNSVAWGNYVVIDVEIAELRAVHNFVGGINSPSEAMLTCRWTLSYADD